MARAQGARAQLALAFETAYGTPPVGGFSKMPFARSSLGQCSGTSTLSFCAATRPG